MMSSHGVPKSQALPSEKFHSFRVVSSNSLSFCLCVDSCFGSTSSPSNAIAKEINYKLYLLGHSKIIADILPNFLDVFAVKSVDLREKNCSALVY
jgi:hypothetical protein